MNGRAPTRGWSRLTRTTFAFVLVAGATVSGGALALTAPVAAAAGTSTTFAYNGTDGSDGSAQEYVVPAQVCEVTVDAYGAEAGSSRSTSLSTSSVAPAAASAMGGHVTATIDVTPSEALQVVVGGHGGDGATSAAIAEFFGRGGAGGYNGGAAGSGNAQILGSPTLGTSVAAVAAGGGGGASDVRRGGVTLDDRVVVAGGAGSSAESVYVPSKGLGGNLVTNAGGHGGGVTGDPGVGGAFAGGGGTATTGGTGGIGDPQAGTAGQQGLGGLGGIAAFDLNLAGAVALFVTTGGSGGGGWFGGGGGGSVNLDQYVYPTTASGGGGGGSSSGPPGATFETGVRVGDGQVTITPADPGVGCPSTLQVEKIVSGTATTGFTEQVHCTTPAIAAASTTTADVDLPFASDGTPDASAPPAGWTVVDGTWQLQDPVLTNSTCTVSETASGGATAVSYQCTWTPGVSDHLAGVGCPGASSGASSTPASVTFEGNADVARLVVTNTFTAPPPSDDAVAAGAVVAAPQFAG